MTEPATQRRPTPRAGTVDGTVPSGIPPFDERFGGLSEGGSYLLVGNPGPAKLVAALHFLQAGVAAGQPVLLLTNAGPRDLLGVARAWGIELEEAWLRGRLRILGFKDDFELRASRSIEPEEVIEELDGLVGSDLGRIVIDPGSLFLAGGTRSLLGSAFLTWARRHPATVCSTFSVDGSGARLPASAEWLVHATTGRLVIESRGEDLHEVSLIKAVPDPNDRDESISLELRPGVGLGVPTGLPSRRGRDRAGVDLERLLLVSLGGSHKNDLEAWVHSVFTADVVSEPFEAVAKAQKDATYGGVLVHAPRNRIREAVSACRALRPLTRAAIVFASDDAIRATDRIQILEAGADDCLSGGISFQELDLRLRQAITSGSRPLPAGRDGSQGPTSLPEGGQMSKEAFANAFRSRVADPTLKFFCVLNVRSETLESDRLAEILADLVRADEGDLVTVDSGRCAVLLQGAREAQLGPFLERLRTRLATAAGEVGGAAPTVEVLAHPAQADRIVSSLGLGSATQT